MALLGIGCLLLTQVSADGSYFRDLFFGLLVFGPGLGACFVAASIAALAGVAEQEAGLASGLNSAAFQIGGALGVAIVSTVAVSYTSEAEALIALTQGYRAGFAAAAVFSVAGLVVAFLLLYQPRRAPIVESVPYFPSRGSELPPGAAHSEQSSARTALLARSPTSARSGLPSSQVPVRSERLCVRPRYR